MKKIQFPSLAHSHTLSRALSLSCALSLSRVLSLLIVYRQFSP